MWFDSHCHLYELGDDADIDAALERARREGVEGVCVLGTDPDTSAAAVRLTRKPGVVAGAAFHPTETEGWQDSWASRLLPLLDSERVVAVGETGIDLHWDRSYLADQLAAFKVHIRLAKERDKALVIHTRDSVDETLATLNETGAPDRLVFHCWSGDLEQLDAALGLGAFISFAGNVSFKDAESLRDAVRAVPSDRLLVETDSPYLAPEPRRGKRNEPAFVGHVGEALSAARGESLQAVADATWANAARLFAL